MNDTERIQQELVKADPSEELVGIFKNLGYGYNTSDLMAVAYEAGREHERKRAEQAEQRCMDAEHGWREAEATITQLQQHAASQHKTICELRSMVDSVALPCNGQQEASE